MRKLLVSVFVAVFVAVMCAPSYGDILVYKTTQTTTIFDTGSLVKETVKGYLVLNVNLDTQTVSDAQYLLYRSKPTKTQLTVNVTVDFNNPEGFVVAKFSNGNVDGILFGKLTGTSNIAKSLSGYLLDSDLGLGTISAKLDTKKWEGSDVPTVAEAIAAFLSSYTDLSDLTPPSPSPMTWASEPNAISDTEITMTATTATDATPPVEYYFTNVTDSSHNSGWQTSATFVDTGLAGLTTYTYTVKARDNAPALNETTASAEANATTLESPDHTAPLPNPMAFATAPTGASDTTITMAAVTATDVHGVSYYFTNVTDTNHNSGWQDSNLFTDTHLTPGTTYAYNVKARDKSAFLNATAASPDTNGTTLADLVPPTPATMSFAVAPNATSTTTITMTAITATDDASPPVMYSFTTATGHNSGWQLSTVYTDTNLTPGTTYTYSVQAQDNALNTNTASAPLSATTPRVADTNAPKPNPMAFATGEEPNAMGSYTSITMSAWDANDDQGVSDYNFTNVTDPTHTSGWLSADANAANWNHNTLTWVDTNLTANTTYAYNVRCRDKALVPNVTSPSPNASATTAHDTVSPLPAKMSFAVPPTVLGSSSVTMTAVEANDYSGVQYKFFNLSGGEYGVGHDSDWQDSRTYIDTGLDADTFYAYAVQARDKSSNHNTNTESDPLATGTATLTTIQEQIDDAITLRNGAVVRPSYPPIVVSITAGTYDGDISFNEPNITLNSVSGPAATVIQLDSDTMGIDMEAGCVLGGSAGSGFTILSGTNGLGMIDATTDDTGYTMEVSYCDINSTAASTTNHGIRVASSPKGVTIAHNRFFTKNNDSAVYLGGTSGRHVDGVTISNNICDAVPNSLFVDFNMTDANSITISDNNTAVGIAIGVGGTGTKVQNVTISGNAFNSASGIQVFEASASNEPNRLMNVHITNNTFAAGSNGYALLIPSGGSALEPNDINWATFTFTNNSVLRTPGGDNFAVDNQIGTAGGGGVVPAILNAQHNFWNDASGPFGGCIDYGYGASISDFVNFAPFWTDAAKTVDANCPI
jgi:hypothetical protein